MRCAALTSNEDELEFRMWVVRTGRVSSPKKRFKGTGIKAGG